MALKLQIEALAADGRLWLNGLKHFTGRKVRYDRRNGFYRSKWY